jgi:2-oxoacid:acceptor oxidoreductase gamma subunit (pyruvate/2-ketoisovalerate family)
MIEIRIHGRGGQGAVTTSRVLAHAAVLEDKYGQSSQIPLGDRRGAPVVAFARIDERPIHLRGNIKTPDILIILDPTLVHVVDMVSDLKEEGRIIINSPQELDFVQPTTYVDATSIAIKHIGQPIVNASILGAFAAATGLVSVDSVEKAFTSTFEKRLKGGRLEKNIDAIRETYEEVMKHAVH